MECDAAIARLTAQVKADLARGIEPRIADLRRLDWKRRLPALAFFCLLCAAGMTSSALGHQAVAGAACWRAAGVVATAIALNGFVLLLHEGMHHTLFKHRLLNWCGSVFFGATVLISFTAYQVIHTRHHAYLGDRRDPDDYHNYTQRRALLWLLHYVRLLFGAPLYILLIPWMAYRHGTPRERRRIVIEYALMGLAYALLWATVPPRLLLAVWIAPLVIVAYLVNIRGFTQHGLTDAADPLLASRSIRANRLVAFCLLHENYHLEHHLFPEIPSYNLTRLHGLISARLPRLVLGTSYLRFIGRFFRATLTGDESPIGLIVRDARAPEVRG